MAFNHQHLILRHVKVHHLLRRKLKKMTAQAAAYPAMRYNDGVRGNTAFADVCDRPDQRISTYF